jgi:molybdate transport system substrate-binding protein
MRRILLYCLLLSFTGALLSAFVSGHLPSPAANAPQQETLIAAAADLQFAMDSMLNIFNRDHPGQRVKAVYGSSGNFYEQILNGAPFDLFFSADMDYPRKLQEQGKTLTAAKQYGTGQIVLWSKTLDPGIAKMNSLLDPSISKIAIANPAHAPYGQRAEESLRYYQLYDKINGRLVLGENISQTAQFVKSGAAEIGIIALSLALSPTMQTEKGKYWLIPAETHHPLQQGYVILQHAKDNSMAAKLADFIGSAQAAPILRYFGISPINGTK